MHVMHAYRDQQESEVVVGAGPQVLDAASGCSGRWHDADLEACSQSTAALEAGVRDIGGTGVLLFGYGISLSVCMFCSHSLVRSDGLLEIFCGSIRSTLRLKVLSIHLTRQTITGSDPECCKVMHVHADRNWLHACSGVLSQGNGMLRWYLRLLQVVH